MNAPEETELTIRLDGDRSNPCLIYLPGVHGDWTLLTSFRELAKEKFFVVQITYPRTLSWTMADYGREVSDVMGRLGTQSGWVLAESFSSQVAWAWLKHARDNAESFRFDGVILAGGFVRYPFPWLARFTGAFFELVPWWLWKLLFWHYALYSTFRLRNAPSSSGTVDEFIARRTKLDIAAIWHRLRLIEQYDPRTISTTVPCPVYLLAGVIDPVVLTWPVLRWLRKNCPAFKASRIIWPADHNVLGTEPAKSLDQIVRWIQPSDKKQPATDL